MFAITTLIWTPKDTPFVTIVDDGVNTVDCIFHALDYYDLTDSNEPLASMLDSIEDIIRNSGFGYASEVIELYRHLPVWEVIWTLPKMLEKKKPDVVEEASIEFVYDELDKGRLYDELVALKDRVTAIEKRQLVVQVPNTVNPGVITISTVKDQR